MIRKILDYVVGLWIGKGTKKSYFKDAARLPFYLIQDFSVMEDELGNVIYKHYDPDGYLTIVKYQENSDTWRVVIKYDNFEESYCFTNEILQVNIGCIVFPNVLEKMKSDLLELKVRERDFLMGKIMGSRPNKKI